MSIRPKLCFLYYFMTFALALFTASTAFGAHMISNANENLMDDNIPMTPGTKLLFTFALCIIFLSAASSLVVLIRQIILGYAYKIDSEGIHNKLNATILFALVIIIAVKFIPKAAIKSIEKSDSAITIKIDKTKVNTFPLLKPIIRSEITLSKKFLKTDETELNSIYDILK